MMLDPKDLARIMFDQHEGERRKLAENEAFAIGMLQAVCAAASFAIVVSLKTFNRVAGPLPSLIALTLLLLGLIGAVAAAVCRHQYKMWDVKAAVVQNDPTEKERRNRRSIRYLWAMRYSMMGAAIMLALSLVFLIGALWYRFLAAQG
jgi:hypothetical protein